MEFKICIFVELGVMFIVDWCVVIVDLCVDWFIVLGVVGFDLI